MSFSINEIMYAAPHYLLNRFEIDDDNWDSRIQKMNDIQELCIHYKLDLDKICPASVSTSGKKTYSFQQKQMIDDMYEYCHQHMTQHDEHHLLQFIMLSKFSKNTVDSNEMRNFCYSDLNEIYDILNNVIFNGRLPKLTLIKYEENYFFQLKCWLLCSSIDMTMYLNLTHFKDMTFMQTVAAIAVAMVEYHYTHDDDFKHIYELSQLVMKNKS